MSPSRNTLVAVALGAVVLAAAVVSPALGGPSLKSLVKKEVKRQLAKKRGPSGAAGSAGPAGQSGAAGAAGAGFNADSSLASGETLTGIWAVAGGPSENAPDAIQFAPQLPAALGPGAVHRLAPGATSAACPGPGQAAAGQLCVYERVSASAGFNTITDPASGANGANRRGAAIQYTTSAANGYADGTWAVTSP
ncbi:MAG: hypothetical protein WBQ41_07280 [Solirubrobacterales bacterium]